MNSGKYLPDTNIVIAFLNGDRNIEAMLNSAEAVYLSVIVLGELLYGAMNSKHVDQNIQRVKQFMEQCALLLVNELISFRYSDIKLVLKGIGHPIPENDIWIGATAIHHGLTLCTRDDHFGFIDGLVLERW
jgi:tRNA(fMet)-specific endonuclease VapC